MSVSQKPKVSIIVPVFNVKKYLSFCLNSIVNQSLRDIEIICGDGGSTDGSLEILKSFAEKDPRIQIISKTGSGYGQSMNDCMRLARGEYIGIVESDDAALPTMFEFLYDKAKSMDCDFVKADFYKFTEEQGRLKLQYTPLSESPQDYGVVLNPHVNREVFTMTLNTWAGIYKREFLETNRIGHNETPGGAFQDTGFWFKTFAHANRVAFFDTPLYLWRNDNPEASVKNRGKMASFSYREYSILFNEFLAEKPHIKSEYGGILVWKKFTSYFWILNMIADEDKPAHLKRFSEEFASHLAQNEMSLEFMYPEDWYRLLRIVEDPSGYLASLEDGPTSSRRSLLRRMINRLYRPIKNRYEVRLQDIQVHTYRIFHELSQINHRQEKFLKQISLKPDKTDL